jgi:Ser/Thr protein kinase RdoA (MazF antagonist)
VAAGLDAGEGDGEAGQPSVPGPVVNESGELVTVTETAAVPGPRPCVMLRWVPGRFVDDGLTPTHLRRVGRFMAGLHRQARSFTPPAGFVRPVVGDLSGDVAAYVIGEIGDVCGRSAAADVARVVDGVAAALDDLGQAPETFGLLHADLHQENYLFNRGRVGAIDFDDCGWGHYAADLAVTLSEIEGRVNTDALRQALFAGYTEVAELPPGTGRYLPAFLARRELQLTLWFIEQRDHPGFAGWADEVTDGLRWLRALAPALPS